MGSRYGTQTSHWALALLPAEPCIKGPAATYTRCFEQSPRLVLTSVFCWPFTPDNSLRILSVDMPFLCPPPSGQSPNLRTQVRQQTVRNASRPQGQGRSSGDRFNTYHIDICVD